MDKEKIKREKEEMKNGMKVVDNMDGEKRANEKIVLDISNVDLSSKMRAAE